MKESKLTAVSRKCKKIESKDGYLSSGNGGILPVSSVLFSAGTAGAISIYEEGSS